MKFIAFAFSIIILACSASAQVLVKSTIADKNNFFKQSDQLPPDATFLNTDGHLMQVAVVPETHILYTVVRDDKNGKPSKKGHLVAYSIKSQKEIWSVRFDERVAILAFFRSMPIMAFNDHSEAFSPADGTPVWRNSMRLREIVPSLGLGLSADHEPGIGKVRGFDLETGEEKWLYASRYLKDLNNFSVFGDTIATISWPDFHQIDLRTGEGFFVDVYNGNAGIYAGAFAVTALFGLVGFTMYYFGVAAPTFRLKVGSDLKSMLVHDGMTFEASSTQILAIEPPGRLAWTFGQSDGFVGVPKIFEHEGAICAVFPGYLSSTDGFIEGHAAIVKINPKNGAVLASTFVSDSKSQFIADFAVNGDTMLVVMNNKMMSLHMDSLTTIESKQFGDVNFGSGLDRIVNPPYYTLKENRIIKESELKLEKLYVQNTVGLKIEISKDFEPVAVVPKTRFFSFAGNIGNYTAYINEYRTVIADENDTLLPYDFSTNFQITESYIWDWDTSNLIVLPVHGMLFKQ